MLLLLAGLLLPAALLLAGLLPGVLVLLARILLARVLSLIAHSEFSVSLFAVGINAAGRDWLPRNNIRERRQATAVPNARLFGMLRGDNLSQLGQPVASLGSRNTRREQTSVQA
jgi:hypothetical protein